MTLPPYSYCIVLSGFSRRLQRAERAAAPVEREDRRKRDRPDQRPRTMHIRSAATMTSLALLARHVAGFRVSTTSGRVRLGVTSSRRPPSSWCSSVMQQQMSSAGASSATAAGAATRGEQPKDHVFDFETPIDRSNTGEAWRWVTV